jgi:hypothetical protein
LVRALRDPLLRIGHLAYLMMLFGVVFLMTVKPSLGTSVLSMLAALLFGMLTGGLAMLVSRGHASPVDAGQGRTEYADVLTADRERQ